MALLKPDAGLPAAENAGRIGTAFDVIDGLSTGFPTLQQQIIDAGNAAAAADIRSQSRDTQLSDRIVALSDSTGASIAALQAASRSHTDGITSLQNQIYAVGDSLRAASDRGYATNEVVTGNTAGINVLQSEIYEINDRAAALDSRLTATIASAFAYADSDATTPTDRPGEALAYVTTSLAGGDPTSLPRPDSRLVASGDSGRVLRMTGAGIVARRRLEPIEDGRTYRPRIAVRRRVNASDPANDGVRVAIRWYDQNRLPLAGTTGITVLANLVSLTVGLGRQQVGGLVSTAGVAPTIKPPAGARYARLFVQCFGTDHVTDVEVMGWRDVTDSSVYSPDLTAFDGRLGAVESEQLPDRVGILEQNAASPLSLGFISTLAAQNTAVPAAINSLDVLGYGDAGDGGGARYRRSTYAPTHPWSVQSKDGSWFEVKGRRTLTQIGGKADGSTDNRPILLKAPASSHVVIDAPGIYRVTPGNIGQAGQTVELDVGAVLRTSSPGSLGIAKGATLISHHEGAGGDTIYWGRSSTGKVPGSVGAVDGATANAFLFFDERHDDRDAGADFAITHRVRKVFGGNSALGGRIGLYVTVEHQDGPTGDSNSNRNYPAIQGSAYAYGGDGGTDVSEWACRGQYFGVAGAVYGGDGSKPAKNVKHLTGLNADVFTFPGGSARVVNAIYAGGLRGHRGAFVDAQIMSSGGDGGFANLPWLHLYAVSDASGGTPVDGNTTLYGSRWLPWPVLTMNKSTNTVLQIDGKPASRIGYAGGHIGDYVTVAGVTGEPRYNGTWVITDRNYGLRAYTLGLDSSGFTGTPDFTNATVTIAKAQIAHGIDLRGFQPVGFAFASPGFGLTGAGFAQFDQSRGVQFDLGAGILVGQHGAQIFGNVGNVFFDNWDGNFTFRAPVTFQRPVTVAAPLLLTALANVANDAAAAAAGVAVGAIYRNGSALLVRVA